MHKTILLLAVMAGLGGCKGEIPLQPVPPTSALTGSEPAPCETLVLAGFPRSVTPQTSNSFVCRTGYVLHFNTIRNTPDWVAFRLNKNDMQKPTVAQNIDESRADPLLPPSLRSERNDYDGVGYDVGFFASPDYFLYDDVLASHAYYLSNAYPQHPDQKMAAKTMVGWLKVQAASCEDLYVVRGPIYHQGQGLGWVGVSRSENATGKAAEKGKIQVPTHTFALTLCPSTQKAVAVVVPNAPQSNDAMTRVSVGQLESLAGLKFFPDWTSEKQAPYFR